MDQDLKIFEGQNILVTGGGGYLGSKLAEVLAGSKFNLKLLDIKFNQISNSLASYSPNVELIETDLTNKKTLARICRQIKPDYIFHFAALLNRNRDFGLYENLYEVNVGGTFNLLESIKDIDYKGFYFASTSEVYGVKNQVPFHEEQQPDPISPYSLTKLMAEMLCKTYAALQSRPCVILRLFNFFGPNMPQETFIGQLLFHYHSKKKFHMTGGVQKRDLIYIDDLLEQILFIAKTNNALYDTYNVCSGSAYKMIDVVNVFRKVVGDNFDFATSLNYRKNEIWEMVGSNQRILSIGYSAKNTPLKDGLEKLLACK